MFDKSPANRPDACLPRPDVAVGDTLWWCEIDTDGTIEVTEFRVVDKSGDYCIVVPTDDGLVANWEAGCAGTLRQAAYDASARNYDYAESLRMMSRRAVNAIAGVVPNEKVLEILTRLSEE